MQPQVEERFLTMNLNSLEQSALELLSDVVLGDAIGDTAMVSSFGAESAALLHLVSRVKPDTPVIFLDTQFLFPETLDYQLELSNKFGLSDVRRITPDPADLEASDPDNDLHLQSTDACCTLRKTRPLVKALKGFDGWITGRKRFQTEARGNARMYEPDPLTGKVKINPLAYWEPQDIKAYFTAHDLPSHPLVARGYPSIGCEPCTSRVDPGQGERSGRWANQDKTECGIHIGSGNAIRSAA